MKVPDDQRQVAPQALPIINQPNQVEAGQFLNPTAQTATESAGKVLETLSNETSNLYFEQLQQANRTRAQDSINQFQQYTQDRLYGPDGALQQRGAAVFSQANSKPLTENVTDDLQQKYSELLDGLNAGEQRDLFAGQADGIITHVRGQMLQFEAEQHRLYARGVGVAAIGTNSNNIALNYNNPEQIHQSLGAIDTASMDLAKLEGYPAEYGLAQASKNKSDALMGAVSAALQQGDHASAMQLVHNFAPHMDTADMIKAVDTITKVQDAQAAYGIAAGVVGQVLPHLQTSDADRAFNITLQAESGGQHFVSGTTQPQVSAKGAVGITQVLPSTGPEAAKLAGVAWDENRFRTDPAYNQALGKAYFNQQVKAFQGDLGLAWAAYNAGPGAVREALDKSAKEGGNWLGYLPGETQQYVTKNMNAYAAGEGQFKKPTLADAIAAADAKLGPSASPQLRKQVRDEVTNQFELQDKAIKQRDDEALAEGYRQLLANNGRYSALPVAVRAAIPADKVDSLLNFGKKLAEGEPIKTDWELYYKLRTDPALLRNTNLFTFRDKLGDAEFKQLSGEQTSGTHAEALTRVRSAGEILNSYMVAAGIDPNPKPGQKDKADAENLGNGAIAK